MEKINCSICNHSLNTHYLDVFNSESIDKCYKLVQCNKCSFIYLNPRLDSNEISSFYNYNYHPFKKSSRIYRNIQYYLFSWKRYIIESYIGSGRLLDVGSGNNNFSKYMSDNNWGVDSYDNYATSTVNDLSSVDDNYYDIITMWHSIEHIYDLDDMIYNIKRVLKKNGFLFIACPNINSIDSKLLGKTWVAYDPPRHIYHFSYKTMKYYLSKNNISIIKYHRMIQDLFFNVLKTKKINIIYKIITLIVSFIIILFSKNHSSSYLFVCKSK